MNISDKKLTKKPNLSDSSFIKNTEFGDFVEIGVDNFIENSKIGDFSYTGQFCFIQNANIEKYSNIAACVRIGATNHPMERPTLHHFTYRPVMFGFDESDDSEFFKDRESHVANIGNDTWIGHGSIILPGVKVGDGAVVGAGSVVTKDVSPYAIVAGNPAKLIRYRFSEEVIEKMLKIKWWDFSTEYIKENYKDFRLNINDFIKKYWKEDI